MVNYTGCPSDYRIISSVI